MVVSRAPGAALAAAAGLLAFDAAGWTPLDLPSLSAFYGPIAFGHLADGRLVYAESGQLYLQAAFGAAGWTAFAGEPALDPSFVAVLDDTHAAAGGGGGFAASPVYAFNPSAPASPGFAAVAGPFQNYQGVYRDASGLYVGGLYSGFTHGIRYVSLDGAVDKVIIENVSTYSAGMARDAAGNLYVGDNDNGGVYRFDVSELAAAISGSALTMADGDLVHDFGDGGHIGSLALDGDGNLWAAGWQQPGLAVYSPRLDLGFEFMPGLSNNNYYVGAFTRDGEDYVAFVNQEDPSRPGSRMIYGYEAVSALVVPEPAAAGLLLLGFAGRGRRRRGM